MDKSEIIDTLYLYYNGHNNPKNPIKSFVSFLDSELVDIIYQKLDDSVKLLFDFDLWLYGKPTFEKDEYILTTTIRSILGNKFGRKNTEKYIENFYAAPLKPKHFLDLMVDTYRFLPTNTTADLEEKAIDTTIVMHKDFPKKIKLHIYEITNDVSFLPEEIKDMFVF